jgi:hypothetical protein
MAITVAMQPVGTETSFPDLLRFTPQAKKWDLTRQTHLFQQPVVAVTIPISIPQTSRYRHGLLMNRRHPHHKHRSQSYGLGQQAVKSVKKGLRLKLRTTVGPADPGGVVEADAQQQALGNLPPQFTPDLKLIDQTVGQALKAVAAHTEVIKNRSLLTAHPMATEPFDPTSAFWVTPPVDATVTQGEQLARHPQGRRSTASQSDG